MRNTGNIYLATKNCVTTFACDDDVGSGVDEFLASLLENLTLLLSDFVEILGVFNENLNTECQFKLVQIKVDKRDLGRLNSSFHLLGCPHCLQDEALEQTALKRALSVRFQNVYILDGVP